MSTTVALPTVRYDLGGGITGLQWVVDGYALPFAALLLTSGAFSDRVGVRRAFGGGLALFVVASALCGVAFSLPMLVGARFVQGAAAAVLGGLLTLLTLLTWRTIFFVNIPVGVAALLPLATTAASPERPAPMDWLGQVTAVFAMGGLTFGAIEAGAWGVGSPPVIGFAFMAGYFGLPFVIGLYFQQVRGLSALMTGSCSSRCS